MFSCSLKGLCKNPKHSDKVLFWKIVAQVAPCLCLNEWVLWMLQLSADIAMSDLRNRRERNSLFNSSGPCSLNQPIEIKDKTVIMKFLSHEQTVETYQGKLILTRKLNSVLWFLHLSCTFWFSIFNGVSMPEVKNTSKSSPFGKLFQLFNLVSKKLNFFSQIFISLLQCLKQWIKDDQRMN